MLTLQSNMLTIVDQTDNRKLEVYIKSNMPTVQIFNQNTGAFSPDWSSGLELNADVYLDSREMESYGNVSFQWSVDDGSSVTQVSTSRTYKITNNALTHNPILTYVCVASYQNITATSKITFTRVDTGRNGTDGRDGTSVRILGTATATPATDKTGYYTITYNNGAITAAALGDAYIGENGHLFVCAILNDNATGNDYFLDVGNIQGPAGQDGADAKLITLNSSSQVFKVSNTGSISPTTITVTAIALNTSVSAWTYSVDGGKIFSSTIPTGLSRNGNTVTITGSTLNVNSVVIKASDGTYGDTLTVYKVSDGVNGTNGAKGDSASLAFLTNENTSFHADSTGEVQTLTTFQTNIVAYNGTIKTTPTIGGISNLPSGMSVMPNKGTAYAKVELTPTNATIDTLYSDQDTKSAIDKTKLANGDSFIVGDYLYKYDQTSNSFKSTVTTVDSVSYLDRIVSNNEITLIFSVALKSNPQSDGLNNGLITIPITSPVSTNLLLSWSKINAGPKGDQGVQGPKGNDGQQYYTWIKYADTPTSGMSDSPDGKSYIGLAYNKTTATESTTYSDYMWSLIKGETGAVGPKGDDGQTYYTWIKYADNASGANMSDSPTGKSYIGLAYNKTTSTESTNASAYTWSLFKGDKGDTGAAGADAYTVLLTNESHVFAGDTANAIASNATTQVLAYKGTTAQTVTVVSVNGVTAATAETATGIAGLTFKCSALSGTTPTITFTCTTSFVSKSGSIPIVLSVGGVSITKMFTYSIAFKGSTGATGGTGSAGAAATAYWLISDASVVQKSSSGSVVLTPSTLTFTGKSKTGTSAPADYKCRWIIAYSTDGSTYTNSYTSSADEASKTFTVDSTYKSIRVRMYLSGGTSTLLDEQIIPVVADGAVGTPGMDAVTFQIYSSNGYALSTNTPNVTLQTFAYVGDVAITAGATYQWYSYSTSGWSAVSGATNAYLTVSRDDVSFSKSYMCKMTFSGVEYTSVATIDDKNDNNKVFTTKPSNYVAGDIWIVGSDYAPSGVEIGTLLKAQYTNTSYADADWIKATKYDDKLKDIQDDLTQYNQYFSFSSSDGVKITAKDSNGVESKYSTTISNDEWAINYGSESVTYVNGTKMHIKEAEIESPLSVTGKYSGSTMLQAPIINIGNFSLVVESNGSLSIVVKS